MSNPPDTLTLPELENYLKNIAHIQYGSGEFTVNWLKNTVESEQMTYKIIIPMMILSDIKLEEETK